MLWLPPQQRIRLPSIFDGPEPCCRLHCKNRMSSRFSGACMLRKLELRGAGRGRGHGTGGGRLGTVREEPLVMAPEVQGSGLLRAAKDVGLPGRCTCFKAQVPLHGMPRR